MVGRGGAGGVQSRQVPRLSPLLKQAKGGDNFGTAGIVYKLPMSNELPPSRSTLHLTRVSFPALTLPRVCGSWDGTTHTVGSVGGVDATFNKLTFSMQVTTYQR